MGDIKKYFSIIAFVLLAFACTGCTTSDTSKEVVGSKAEDGQVEEAKEVKEELVIRLAGGDTGIPNPYKHHARGPGMSKMQLIYDSLIEKDEKGNIPWIAKSWEVSEDGLVYTFEIRDNILWNDGKKLTAEDVKFTFDYYKDHPPVSNSLISSDEYIIKESEVVDGNKVEITVNNPEENNIVKIGFMRIIPKHIWENVEDPTSFEGEGNLVGCGPYTMTEYNSEQGIYRFEEFEDYWGLKQKVNVIEWVPVSDSILAFENEEIDIIRVSSDILAKYKNDTEYKVLSKHSYHTYKLMMNMERREEFLDVNVRKAIAYAINREELIDKVERGSAVIGSMGYVPEIHPFYNDSIKKYDYNPEKAKELLNGKEFSFKLLIGNSEKEVKLAELMKITLAEAGIDIKVESVDSKSRDAVVKDNNYELVLINYGGLGGDPGYLKDIYGSNGKGSSALPGYTNKEIEELAQQQQIQMDNDKRKNMIFKLQELIAEDVPMVVIYGSVVNHVYRPAKHDGWMCRYDHNMTTHNKLSYLERDSQ